MKYVFSNSLVSGMPSGEVIIIDQTMAMCMVDW